MLNPDCDGAHCRGGSGVVRKLPLGGGANLILCRACFEHESRFRRGRNAELGEDAQFELPGWSTLEIYNNDGNNRMEETSEAQ